MLLPFFLFIFLSETKIDPLFLANILAKRHIEKAIVVKKIESTLNLFNMPDERKKIPIWIKVKGKSLENIINCVKSRIGCKEADEIIYIRLPRKLKVLGQISNEMIPRIAQKIKESDEEVGASEAREIYRVSGKGVLVGIIDTGVRWKSKWLSFPIKDEISGLIDSKGERNFSKVIRLWDQRPLRDEDINFPDYATYPVGFTYGFECFEPARRSSEGFPDYNKCDSEDLQGHGTHISGIIGMDAGEGEIGVSPDAPIIAVPTNMYEDEVVDAVRYIFNIADSLSLPAVINISLGGHFGPHDGTSLFETLLIQNLGKGKIIVAAAGNEGREKIHIGGKYSGTLSAIVTVRDDCEIQFWFPQDSGAEIEVVFKGVKGKVKKGQRSILINTKESVALIDFTSSADIPYTYLIQYSLSPVKDSAVFVSIGNVGDAQINITLPKETEFDAWISSDPISCFFTEQGDLKPNYDKTIAVPSTAKEIVSVGYYIIDGDNKGKISPNSSRGSDDMRKPDIVAPGQKIFSLCPTTDEYICAGSGSSQATPHVSGAITLALERNPELTPQEVIDYLCKSARKDEFTGDTPNKVWGCGKLDIPQFLSFIPPLSRKFSDYKLSYSTKRENVLGGTYIALIIQSDYPFRILGPGFYDSGWAKKHKLYVKQVPDYIDVEFLDKNTKRFNLVGEGIKLGEDISCGCFSSSPDPILSLIYLIFFVVVIGNLPRLIKRQTMR